MKLFQVALVLLVQLSLVFVHGNSEAPFQCATTQTAVLNVINAGAQLTEGCVLQGNGITFELKAMYTAKGASKTSVEISISNAAFINSYIKLTNGDSTPADINTQVPLLFTMSKTKMSGTSSLEFGIKDKLFNLPPKSSISIVDSQLTISSTTAKYNAYMFTFHSLQLVGASSIEIARNVITMECTGCDTMAVFHLHNTGMPESPGINQPNQPGTQSILEPTGKGMKISGESSVTLKDNKITMKGHTSTSIKQYIWYQYFSPLSILSSSRFAWTSNTITMVGYDVTVELQQYLWFQDEVSPLTIDASTYTLSSNIISMVGYGATSATGDLDQYVWFQDDSSPLTISQSSKYKWSLNSITMDGHNVKRLVQFVLFAPSAITISALSQLLFETNKILMLAKDYSSIQSYVMRLKGSIIITRTIGTISGGSSMIWKDNCIGMGHKKTDKRNVFGGKWSISGEGSELLLDGTKITTTDKYENSGKLTELVWGPTSETDITDSTKGTLTIRNTKVYINSAGSATGSMMWSSSPLTSEIIVKQPAMQWSSSAAKDGRGNSVPTLDNSNLQQYMCGIPTPILGKIKAEGISPTAILSTIPAVIISSVVFLYFFM